eukprot:2931-Heterococcus_DN1.PRE.10
MTKGAGEASGFADASSIKAISAADCCYSLFLLAQLHQALAYGALIALAVAAVSTQLTCTCARAGLRISHSGYICQAQLAHSTTITQAILYALIRVTAYCSVRTWTQQTCVKRNNNGFQLTTVSGSQQCMSLLSLCSCMIHAMLRVDNRKLTRRLSVSYFKH